MNVFGGSGFHSEARTSVTISSTCVSVRPLYFPWAICTFNSFSTPSIAASMAIVANSLVFQSRLSRPKISPKRCALRYWSIAGAKANTAPCASRPNSLRWLAAPYSTLLLTSCKVGNAPSASLMPRALRSCNTPINVFNAPMLRGKPQ